MTTLERAPERTITEPLSSAEPAPKAGGSGEEPPSDQAPSEDSEEPPEDSPAPTEDYQARPCSDEAGTCGIDAPPRHKCWRVYDGDAGFRPTGEPEFYSCQKIVGNTSPEVEGPDGQRCNPRLIYAGPNDTDPERQYECEADPEGPDVGRVCGYDEGWKPLWCAEDDTWRYTGPGDRECGPDDCGLDVPERYSCLERESGVVQFVCSDSEYRHYAKAPHDSRCLKTTYFERAGSRPDVFYLCNGGGPHGEEYCSIYDEGFEPVTCPPGGGGDAAEGAQGPSDDAQDAIKHEREEPGGGWESIRDVGRRLGSAALGFVRVGDGGAAGPVVFSGPSYTGASGGSGTLIRGAAGVEVGNPPELPSRSGAVSAMVAKGERADATVEGPVHPSGGGPINTENLGADATGGRAPKLADASAGADVSGADGSEASGGSEPGGTDEEEREGGVLSASQDQGPTDGGASGANAKATRPAVAEDGGPRVLATEREARATGVLGALEDGKGHPLALVGVWGLVALSAGLGVVAGARRFGLVRPNRRGG